MIEGLTGSLTLQPPNYTVSLRRLSHRVNHRRFTDYSPLQPPEGLLLGTKCSRDDVDRGRRETATSVDSCKFSRRQRALSPTPLESFRRCPTIVLVLLLGQRCSAPSSVHESAAPIYRLHDSAAPQEPQRASFCGSASPTDAHRRPNWHPSSRPTGILRLEALPRRF